MSQSLHCQIKNVETFLKVLSLEFGGRFLEYPLEERRRLAIVVFKARCHYAPEKASVNLVVDALHRVLKVIVSKT